MICCNNFIFFPLQAVKEFDNGEEEQCKMHTTVAMILNIVGTVVACISTFVFVLAIYLRPIASNY